MWKLTIAQKRKSEYSDNTFIEKVECLAEDICYLTSMIDNFSALEAAFETVYEIRKIAKEGDE
jgi:hypothetical protein